MAADRVEQLPDDEPAWWDHEAGPVVRPYMVTGGRVEPKTADLDLITHVVAVSNLAAETPSPEHQAILALTQEPRPVAEVAARIDLPLGVVRVLLCDLLSEGLVARYDPPPAQDLPDIDTLQAVIHGLRSL
jgi:hypothetical protein